MRTFPPLPVDSADVGTLQEWAGSGDGASTVARRARIVLLSADGLGPTAVAAELGCSKQTVITWRERYRADGLTGLRDAPRSGRPVSVDPAAVIERTLQELPPRLRARRWSSRLLASELGVSNVAVANVWRSWGVVPREGGRVRLATEPPLDDAPAAVAGMHLDPDPRLLMLTVGKSCGAPVPLRERPRLGARLDDLEAGRHSDPDALAAFLAAFDDVPADVLRLVADDAPPVVTGWAGRRGVALHVVPRTLSFTRLARVASVLAGRTAAGAVSVAELRQALVGHVPGRPFAWVDPELVATDMH
ncbi:helix-turn-helix domain-containing protein [Pseudonocardia sp.]|uniref:helix-turn-helix domain-containing protein n=1 Tax=Pseudonocardia sp. TaxID=60912 RepID=UPI0026313C66|nr:helix-turn-helix domain-containing protein [Pseudonocardia sp.]